MPIYEYECRVCGARTEELQKLDEAPLLACARCGGGLERILTTRFEIAGATPAREERSSCSFESRGVTCCGSSKRCGAPACGK